MISWQDTVEFLKEYTFGFIFVSLIHVYLLNTPQILLGKSNAINDLITKYYYTDGIFNVLSEYILIYPLYILISLYLIKKMKITDNILKFLLCILVTCLISGLFYLLFISRPMTKSFFSKWFHTVGWKAIVYDVLMVSSVFMFLL